MKTSVVNGYHVFPKEGLFAHLLYSSSVSQILRLSSGMEPTDFTRCNVCTMLVFTWECSLDLHMHQNCKHNASMDNWNYHNSSSMTYLLMSCMAFMRMATLSLVSRQMVSTM